MEMEGFREVNGNAGYVTCPPPYAPVAGTRSRIPTVFEALPFTPLSSIVPFNPHIIPTPLATPSVTTTAFAAPHDVQSTVRVLDRLSAGASSAENASERCQQTICDVQKLLDPESLTQFKFKPRRTHNTGMDSTVPGTKYRPPSLSPIAQMVFENSGVSYRYLTPGPSEPESTTKASEVSGQARKSLPTPESCSRQEAQQTNGYSTPHHDPHSNAFQGSRVHAVVVPATLTQAQRAEFLVVSEDDSMAGVDAHLTPSIQNRSLVNGTRVLSVDQRQKGDGAVQSLQTLLAEIFIAEDQLGDDATNYIFASYDANSGAAPTLQLNVQTKLDLTVQKVIRSGRLDSIDVEHLARAQRFCESAVSASAIARLQIAEDWSEQDIEEWSQCLPVIERGLVASRTLMRTMSAGLHLKELQSEDFLRMVLETLRNVVEACIVPTVEMRALMWERVRGGKDEPPRNAKFAIAESQQNLLQTILHAVTKCLRVLGDFLTQSELDESALSSVEYLCKSLIFAENASNARDSMFGIQNFESVRRCAMDVLARMFAHYADQRQFILDEILISLEKLPATKQSARQYRLTDAKPIQLVSALLMRLLQTSATSSGDTLLANRRLESKHTDREGLDDESIGASDNEYDPDEIKVSTPKTQCEPKALVAIVKPLNDAAQLNASYIVKVLIQRALVTSKSSDEPYRKLLDIFTEDFLNVLGSIDWPSSELLLRTLAMHMISIVENTKSPVPSRTLALELLGSIGTGILSLQIAAGDAAGSIDQDDAGIAQSLIDDFEHLDASGADTSSLVSSDGPFRNVIDLLQIRSTEDAQITSARGYYLMQWAFYICGGREVSTDSEALEAPRSSRDLQRQLFNMILDSQWLEEHYEYPNITAAQGRLAAMIITLNSKLCKAFSKIFGILLSGMNNEHSTIKSRSMKGVIALVEKGPSVLDRNHYVLHQIFRCANDSSSLVRDSALQLIATCQNLRPELDERLYERVIARTKDTAVGVRKRAMKILKVIYLRNDHDQMRSAIAQAIISRIDDSEESVTDIARQIMEEIWFLPFYSVKLAGKHAIQGKLAYGKQAALLIRTTELGDNVLRVLEPLVKELLTRSKSANANEQVCKTVVSVLSDGIISDSDIPGSPPQDAILRTLSVFAKADPSLLTATQLERLEPYTQNLTKTDDLEVYRSAITILRHTVPHQPMLNQDFLQRLQNALLSSVAKLPKRELNEVVPCLWTINNLVQNTNRLVTLVVSALNNIHSMRGIDLSVDEKLVAKMSKLMVIAGQFGKACDFERQLSTFKEHFQWYKGDSVPGLVVEVLCPFTSPKQPLEIRQTSLDAVCMVAQSWPKTLLRPDVVNSFETVFLDRIYCLEEVLLAGLAGFFCPEDMTTGVADFPELGSGVTKVTDKFGRSYTDKANQDGASTSIAQRFLPQFLRLSLSSCDELAFTAAKIVVSVNRQGIVHPKESCPALIALETCPNRAIASIAFVEHRAQYAKHEALFDKEHIRAAQQAFEYQNNVIGDSTGFTGRPPVAKMHLLWEVLKTAKAQVRKKFLNNLPQRMGFSLKDLDVGGVTPPHLLVVRFYSENLALFEYDRVDDILLLLESLEKTFACTGTAVAQTIESEVMRIQVNRFANGFANEGIDGCATMEAPAVDPVPATVDPICLRQLAVSAQICSLIFETRTVLRRVWSMQKYLTKAKGSAKANDRAPTRSTNASGLIEAYLKKTCDIITQAEDTYAQQEICRSFVELMSVENEVRVESDDEGPAEFENGYDTPSESTSGKSPSLPPSGGGRSRKRKTPSGLGGPQKRGRPSVGRKASSSARLAINDDDGDGGWD